MLASGFWALLWEIAFVGSGPREAKKLCGVDAGAMSDSVLFNTEPSETVSSCQSHLHLPLLKPANGTVSAEHFLSLGHCLGGCAHLSEGLMARQEGLGTSLLSLYS